MKPILLALAAFVVVGCGADATVTVGNPGQKGVIRSDIDQSRSVANQVSTQVGQGDKDANGG